MRKKLNELSSYDAILCLLVVLIHVMSEAVVGYRKGSLLSVAAFFVSRAATFVVPAFIMSSGIKHMNKYGTKPLKYLQYMAARLKKIYLPYALIAAVYYLYYVFILKYFPFNLHEMLISILNGTAASPFYFIVIIMQFYLLTPLWGALARKISPKIYLPLAAALTIFSQYTFRTYTYGDRVFLCYLLYWLIGCSIGTNFEEFKKLAARLKNLIVAIGTVATIAYVAMAYAEFCGVFGSFYTEFVKLVFCTSASLMYLSFMPTRPVHPAERIAAVSYYIYLIHCLILLEVTRYLDKLSIVSLSKRLVLRAVFVYTLSIVLTLLYKKIKKLLTNNFYKCKI